MKDDDLNDFKANWPEFFKWCENRRLPWTTYKELTDAIDEFIAEALRIRTTYDN